MAYFRSAVVALSLAVLFSTSVNVSGAAKRGRPAQKAKIDPISALATMQAVNAYHEGDNLADSCRHANFKGLAYALNMNAPWLRSEKREFETSDEFNQRSNKLADVMGKGQIIVCQSLYDNEDAPFAYAADTENFAGTISDSQNIWRDVKQLGRFKTRTRMGIPFTVSASSEVSYDASFEIKANRNGCLSNAKYSSSRNYKVPVPRSDAPVVKGSGYLVYIGRLSAPYVEASSSHDTASLDDPYEVIRNGITVRAKVEKLVVVDGKGKEWWSCDPLKSTGAQPPKPTNDISTWVKSSDYPIYGSGEKPKGDVGIKLQVSAYGSVTSCSVTESSGNKRLDDATCLWAEIRAQFQPAVDELGNETSGSYSTTIHWSWPQ